MPAPAPRSVTTAVNLPPRLGHGQISSIFAHPMRLRYVRDTWQPFGYVVALTTSEKEAKRVGDRVSDIQAENAEEELRQIGGKML